MRKRVPDGLIQQIIELSAFCYKRRSSVSQT